MDDLKVSNGDHIDLMQILRTLLRRWFVILLAGIIAASVGFVYANFFITPLYRAKSTMLVDLRNSVHDDLSAEQVNVAQKYVSTFAYIMRTNTVLDPVIEELELSETASSLASKLQITELEDTLLIKVSIDYYDKEIALDIIEAICEVAPDVINERITSGYIIEIESATVSSTPVSPDIAKYTVVGGAVGVVAAALVIIVIHLFNNKVRSTEDISSMLSLPILGVIPSVTDANVKGGK